MVLDLTELSLKLFMIMIQSLRSISDISAEEIIKRELQFQSIKLLNKPNDKHHIVYEQEIKKNCNQIKTQ